MPTRVLTTSSSQAHMRRLFFFFLLVLGVLLTSFLLFWYRRGAIEGVKDQIIALCIACSFALLTWVGLAILRLSWRREADEALRESEERLRISQRIAQIGSWDWDLASDRVTCTDEIYRIFGVAGESFPKTYSGFLQLLPPEDRNALSIAIRSALYGGSGYALEHRVLRPDGNERIVLETGEVFQSESGEPLRVVSVVHDITERKQAESALSFERRYRALIENLPQAIYLKDKNSRYVSCNSSFARDLGLEPAEIFGKTDRELFPEEVADRRMADDGLVMEAGRTEERDEWRDGTWVSHALIPLKDDGGVVYGLLGVATDITLRKRAEDRLKESEERFRSTFEQAAVGIGHLDLAGVVIRINPRFCDIIGYSQDELLGRTLDDLTHPDDLERDRALMRRLLDGEIDKYGIEKRYIRSDGSQVWVNVTKSLAFSSSGARYIIGVVEDVTQKREAEELKREHDLVKAASLAKSRFLATMSHEIRTPMNAIIGMSLLALKTNLTVKQRGYLEKIHASSRVLLNIINDTLEFSRFEAGKIELEHLDFPLAQVLKSVHDIFSAKAAEKGISLRYLVDPELPEQVLGDALRLTQVLGNLVGNAVKFTDCGGVVVGVIHCGTTRGESSIRFFVRDTGLGIPADQLETVFTPFTQADSSTTRRFGGTGLGLSIGRQLVELMEGTLEVESELGAGSTFSFTIPMGVCPQPELPDQKHPAQLPRVKVLVDGGLPTGMTKVLRDFGMDVKKGTTMVAEVEQGAVRGEIPCDLLLVDARGRLSEGVETVRRMGRNRNLVGVATALLVDREQMESARDAAPELAPEIFVAVPADREPLWDSLLKAFIHRHALRSSREAAGEPATDEPREPESAETLYDVPLPLFDEVADVKRLSREISELERLLAKNSLDAKKQYLRVLREFPSGSSYSDLKALGMCLDRLDFRKAREIVSSLANRCTEERTGDDASNRAARR